MIRIKYNRRALCMGDDIYNGVYIIALPDDAVLKDLIEVLLHGGNGNDWPIPHNHDGWLIYANIGYIAHVSADLKHVDYCDGAGNTLLSVFGIQWVFGEYMGTSQADTAYKCKRLFRE